MKFQVQIDVSGITQFEPRSHLVEEAFENHPNKQVLISYGRDPEIWVRGVGRFPICSLYTNRTHCFEVDDFVVGGTPDDRPPWFPHLKHLIVETTGFTEYGAGQGLRVAESLVHGAAEARIRCEQGLYTGAGCVYKVKIHAGGGAKGFADALRLHAMILSGEAYST